MHVPVLDRRHRYHVLRALVVDPLTKKHPEDSLQWFSKPLWVNTVRRKDSSVLIPYRTIKLSRSSNVTTRILRRDAQFPDVMCTVLLNTDTFREGHGTPPSMRAHLTLLRKCIAPNCFSKGRTLTYLRYTRVGKLVVTHKDLSVFTEKLAEHKGARSILAVTHLDDSPLPTRSSKVVFLLFNAAFYDIQNP